MNSQNSALLTPMEDLTEKNMKNENLVPVDVDCKSTDVECLRTNDQPSDSRLDGEKTTPVGNESLLGTESEVSNMEPGDLDLIQPVVKENPHQTIMSACSSLGQHIRENITSTLNSRLTSEPAEKDTSFSVINNLGETFMQNISKSLASNAGNASVPPKDISQSLDLIGPAKCDNVENLSSPTDRSIICNDKSSESLQDDSCLQELKNEVIPPIVEQVLEESAADVCSRRSSEETASYLHSSLSDHIRQTIEETLKSNNKESAVDSNGNLASALEATIMKQLENFEQSLMVKWNDKISKKGNVQEDNEENDSLSEEADSIEKEVDQAKATPESQQVANTNSKSTVSLDKDKTNKKNQKVNKKKGEKTIGFFTNQILKSLSGVQTTEEKLNILCRKHAESLEKLKSTENVLKQNERQIVQLSREKEQLQADHNRNILAKSRLESLCRELQRQNKAVKDENLIRIREEEEKRKEVASKFQTTLNEISNLMQENSKKNLQLKEENAELAQKLKTLVEHYEMWEKHMEKVVQQKDLEIQLAKVKEAKTNLQLKQDTENFLCDKQALLQKMNDMQKKCTLFASKELQLQAELSDYSSKYEEFQNVISKSNQVFASFKTDMDSTSKKIKKLEKETNAWKLKWESSNNALLEMITDKQTRDKELVNSQQRILTLEKLCRALQAERNELQSQIKKGLVEEHCNITEEVTQAC